MRDSFIFYRSFYEAISALSDADRLSMFDAICNLALNQNETKLEPLPNAMFTLIKPQLEANNKRFDNGKKGGRPKTKTKPKDNQNESKAEANKNVNVNENVNANVNNNNNANEVSCVEPVVEIIDDDLNPRPNGNLSGFDVFWGAYPVKIKQGLARMSFYKALKKTSMETILEAIQVQKQCTEWQKENGKFIPHPNNWLDDERWLDEINQAPTLTDKMNAVRQMSEEGII